MLDFGWSEFFLIIILGVVLLGPKDIPELVYQFGRLVRRAQYMKFAMSKQFDDFMMQNDLQELRRGGTLGDMKGDVRAALTLPAHEPTSHIDTTQDPTRLEEEEYYAELPPALDDLPALTLPLEGGGGKRRAKG